MMILSGCNLFQDDPIRKSYQSEPITLNPEIPVFCINVTGIAIGDITTDAMVYLFQIKQTDYTYVMQYVRTAKPIANTQVNSTKEFWFPCLGYGKYVFVINASDYNKSIGSPLPYTFDCENFSVDVIFQGGNSEYATGVFEIRSNYPRLKSVCKNDLISNLTRKKEKGLYKWCPYCAS